MMLIVYFRPLLFRITNV